MNDWTISITAKIDRNWRIILYTHDDSEPGYTNYFVIAAPDEDEAVLKFLQEYWDKESLAYYSCTVGYDGYIDSATVQDFLRRPNMFIDNGFIDSNETESGFYMSISAKRA